MTAVAGTKGDPYKRLAAKLREIARSEAKAHTPSIERFKVVRREPLALHQVHGDVVLEDGDDDFEVEHWVRQYDAMFGIDTGDTVFVQSDGDTYLAIGVEGAKRGYRGHNAAGAITWEAS